MGAFCIAPAEKGFSAKEDRQPSRRAGRQGGSGAGCALSGCNAGAKVGPASPATGILLYCQLQTNPFYLLVQVSMP